MLQFTLAKPPTNFDEWDFPKRMALPPGGTYGARFKLADWSVTTGETTEAFALAGKYQVRAIYQLDLRASEVWQDLPHTGIGKDLLRERIWKGKLVSPAATFTLTAAKPPAEADADNSEANTANQPQGNAAGRGDSPEPSKDIKFIPFLPKARESMLLMNYKVDVDGIDDPAIFKRGTPVDQAITVKGNPVLQENGSVRVVVHTRSAGEDSWIRLTTLEIPPRNGQEIVLHGAMKVI